MFLRVNKNSQGKEYLQILRSYRDSGKVRQEVLFTMGRLDILQATGQMDALVAALSKFCVKQKLIDLARDVSVDQIYNLGAAHVIGKMLDRLKLFDLFEGIERQHPKLDIPWSAILFAMIANRFIHPSSKKSLADHWIKKIYPGLVPVTLADIPLHYLYRSMDILWKHRESIEQALFERAGQRDLFNQTLDIIFYDTTTLRFESTIAQNGALRQFGYSKERRSDCTQVVLGLLVDRDGVPVGYKLFPGNTYDGQSVPAILGKFQERFQVARIVMVADRGMLSKENLKALRAAKMEFILGMRLWSAKKTQQRDFYDHSKYHLIHEGLKGREIPWGDDRLILTWSQDRAERDAKAREDLLAKIQAKLKTHPNPKRFVTNAGYRKFLKGLSEGKPRINTAAIAQAQERDGFFGILTNIPSDKLSAREIVARYKDLWRIEDAFGEMKGPLETRPMFHWTDRRIEAHVLLCVLAYYVEAVITSSLRDKKAGFSTGAFLRSLNEVHAVPVRVNQTTAWIRNELPAVAAKGYQMLQIGPPNRVLKIDSPSVVTRNFSN